MLRGGAIRGFRLDRQDRRKHADHDQRCHHHVGRGVGVLLIEALAHALTLPLIGLDDEDAARHPRKLQARDDVDQPFAVDRLGQVPGRTQRNAAALLVDDRDDDGGRRQA